MQGYWRERYVSKATSFSKLSFCQYLYENIWSETEAVIDWVSI